METKSSDKKIKLYHSNGSAAFVVHWMLIELGLPFELHPINLKTEENKSEEYLKVNPKGKVPAMELDGKVYTESVALLFILSDLSSPNHMKPKEGTEEHSKWYELMVYFANGLMPQLIEWFLASYYNDNNPAIEAFIKEKSRVNIEQVWNIIDGILGSDGRKYLLGDQYRSVDFLAIMLMRWTRNYEKPATSWPNINAYVQRMRSLPSFIEVNKREELTDWLNN